MKTGADAAFLLGADAVVFMDSDGQHKVKDLPHFIEALEKDKFDVVFGSRNLSHGVPFIRYMGNKFASMLISLLFVEPLILLERMLEVHREMVDQGW